MMSSTEPEPNPTTEASAPPVSLAVSEGPLSVPDPAVLTSSALALPAPTPDPATNGPPLPNLPPPLTAEANTAPTLPDATEAQLTLIEDTPRPPPRPPRWRLQPHIPADALLRWAPWALGIGSGILLLILAFTARSWGDSSTRSGFTLLGIFLGAALIIALARLRQRQWVRRRWLALSAALLVVSLLGIFLAPTIHTAQAHLLEQQGNYQRAIEEYTAGGEQGTNAQNISRAYLEWGQANLANRDYQQAVEHLTTLVEDYSDTAAARQAAEPLSAALLGWGKELLDEKHYEQAIQQFDTLRGQYSASQAAAQLQQGEDEPYAYLLWGLDLQARQQFQDALAKYVALRQLFPNSRYNAQAYNAAASDLYAWGQALAQQNNFDAAVSRYQQLIAQYANAREATQAQQELAAPQTVSGRLLLANGAADARVVIRLSSSWTTGPSGYLQGGYVFETKTDANGVFQFTNIPIGTYLVDWQQGSAFSTLLHQGTYNPVYLAQVKPLRPADLGVVQLGS